MLVAIQREAVVNIYGESTLPLKGGVLPDLKKMPISC